MRTRLALIILLAAVTAYAGGQIGVTGYPAVPRTLKGGTGINIKSDGTFEATGEAVSIGAQPFENLSTALRGKFLPISGTAADANAYKGASSPSATEFNYLQGVTSGIQSQLNGKIGTSRFSSYSSNRQAEYTTQQSVIAGKLDSATAATTYKSQSAFNSFSTATQGKFDAVYDTLQPEIDAKQSAITGAATTIASANLTASRAVVSNSSGKVAVSTVTSAELGYLSGVTSSVQTQLNGKLSTSTAFNGDVSGTASNLQVLDDSHAHTSATLPLNNSTQAGIVATGAGQVNKVWKTDSSGIPQWRDDATGGSPSFDTLTGGTNTASTFVIGTGSSLTYAGTGAVDASRYKGEFAPTAEEFSYLSGVTSGIQEQINGLDDATQTALDGKASTSHASTHMGGNDPITPAGIGAATAEQGALAGSALQSTITQNVTTNSSVIFKGSSGTASAKIQQTGTTGASATYIDSIPAGVFDSYIIFNRNVTAPHTYLQLNAGDGTNNPVLHGKIDVSYQGTPSHTSTLTNQLSWGGSMSMSGPAGTGTNLSFQGYSTAVSASFPSPYHNTYAPGLSNNQQIRFYPESAAISSSTAAPQPQVTWNVQKYNDNGSSLYRHVSLYTTCGNYGKGTNLWGGGEGTMCNRMTIPYGVDYAPVNWDYIQQMQIARTAYPSNSDNINLSLDPKGDGTQLHPSLILSDYNPEGDPTVSTPATASGQTFMEENQGTFTISKGGGGTLQGTQYDGKLPAAISITGSKVTLATGTTAAAPLNLPQGAAPTSPVNGDIWTTSAGMYARINGSTVGPFSAATAAGVPYSGATGAIDLNAQNVSNVGTFSAGKTTASVTGAFDGLAVIASSTTTDNTGATIATQKRGTTSDNTSGLVSGSLYGGIRFKGWNSSNNGYLEGASIYAYSREAWSSSNYHGSGLLFNVAPTGAAASNATNQAGYINSTGNWGIGPNQGYTAPPATLMVRDNTASTGATRLLIAAGATTNDATTNKLLEVKQNNATPDSGTSVFSVTGAGNVTAAGTVTATGAVSGASVAVTGAVTGASASFTGNAAAKTFTPTIPAAATDGATVTFDLSAGDSPSVTLGGNRTLAFTITSANVGSWYTLTLKQGASGGPYTVTWPSSGLVCTFIKADGTTTTTGPTLHTAASSRDTIVIHPTSTTAAECYAAGY